MPGGLNSPVDGALIASGRVEDGTLIQAKGLPYRLDELLAADPLAARFEGGAYATLYLSPRDYHRIHVPCAGRVLAVGRVEGELWPVNEASTAFTPGLYVRNRQGVLDRRGDGRGRGARRGGRDGGRDARRGRRRRSALARGADASPRRDRLAVPGLPCAPGDDLGTFELGSTVVLLVGGARARGLRLEPPARAGPRRAAAGSVRPLTARLPATLRAIEAGPLVRRRALRLLAGAALAAALGGPLAAAPPELRWGGDAEGGAPFVEADPNDPSKLRGFDVEIAAELGRRMGRAPRFVQVAYSSIDQSVDRGDFEIGLSGRRGHPGPSRRALGDGPLLRVPRGPDDARGGGEALPDPRVAPGPPRRDARGDDRLRDPPRRGEGARDRRGLLRRRRPPVRGPRAGDGSTPSSSTTSWRCALSRGRAGSRSSRGRWRRGGTSASSRRRTRRGATRSTGTSSR